jgi:hypothetical protein
LEQKPKVYRGPFNEHSCTTRTIETKLPSNDHWKFLYKVSVFYADRKSKMATIAGHRLTLNPMGKYSKSGFREEAF